MREAFSISPRRLQGPDLCGYKGGRSNKGRGGRIDLEQRSRSTRVMIARMDIRVQHPLNPDQPARRPHNQATQEPTEISQKNPQESTTHLSPAQQPTSPPPRSRPPNTQTPPRTNTPAQRYPTYPLAKRKDSP